MNVQHEQISAATALDHVRRELVAITASIAEHGPTDPQRSNTWAYDELKKVIAYIRAVEMVEQPPTTD